MSVLRTLLICISFLISFNGTSQRWRDYFPQIEGHHVEFSTHEYIDTIWCFRDNTNRRVHPKQYSFPVKNTCEDTVLCGYSSRIGGADPDYNSKYPRVLSPGESSEYVFWFPGRVFNPPYIHKRVYVANNNSEYRDTLIIQRVFLWADRDTIHQNVSLGDHQFSFVNHEATYRDPILFINLHEDELTSIEALQQYSKGEKISYTYLEHSRERRICFQENNQEFSIDPNRIFTDSGRVHTLLDGENYSVEADKSTKRFAQRLMWKINHRSAIIALHNNTDTNYSILSYLPDSSEAPNVAALFINPEMDPDDFIYTTDTEIYEAMVKHEINVILQNNTDNIDDGSLSVYCGIKEIRYVNIETEHGHLEKQLELMRLVHQLLKSD